MAVGMIITCEVCGKSYDEGRTSHFDCDGGADIRRKADELAKFNALSGDERMEILYKMIMDLTEHVNRMPYRGMIG